MLAGALGLKRIADGGALDSLLHRRANHVREALTIEASIQDKAIQLGHRRLDRTTRRLIIRHCASISHRIQRGPLKVQPGAMGDEIHAVALELSLRGLHCHSGETDQQAQVQGCGVGHGLSAPGGDVCIAHRLHRGERSVIIHALFDPGRAFQEEVDDEISD